MYEKLKSGSKASSMALVLRMALATFGQTTAQQFVPFKSFVESTKAANVSDYAARSTSKVKDTAAFEEMRQHILNLYQRVEVSHSFVLDGDHLDCVPTQQQPAVRMLGLKSIATVPPASVLLQGPRVSSDHGESTHEPTGITSQLGPDTQFDEFGNSRRCEDNTIPMRRVTLEETCRFATLKNFFEARPDGSGHAPGMKEVRPLASVAHKVCVHLPVC
jgi:hypothetical protein